LQKKKSSVKKGLNSFLCYTALTPSVIPVYTTQTGKSDVACSAQVVLT